jgi:hypothetical protein
MYTPYENCFKLFQVTDDIGSSDCSGCSATCSSSSTCNSDVPGCELTDCNPGVLDGNVLTLLVFPCGHIAIGLIVLSYICLKIFNRWARKEVDALTPEEEEEMLKQNDMEMSEIGGKQDESGAAEGATANPLTKDSSRVSLDVDTLVYSEKDDELVGTSDKTVGMGGEAPANKEQVLI